MIRSEIGKLEDSPLGESIGVDVGAERDSHWI